VLSRRLHRKIGRLLSLEDPIDIARRVAELLDAIGTVGDQSAGRNKAAAVILLGVFVGPFA